MATQIESKIHSKAATVCIIGLGYVGLPLAIVFAEKGFSVRGYDTDRKKIDSLRRCESYIDCIENKRLQAVVGNRSFVPTTEYFTADVVIICVPTPLTRNRTPDVSYIESTVNTIREHLIPGQLIILESTTYPGTTDTLVKDKLESSGLKCGEDFFLAFSPEREDPGNKKYSTTSIPKLVGGVTVTAGMLAHDLYSAVIDNVIRVADAKIAEAAKLTENIFRAVNIALVNELKIVYDRLGIDIWNVLDAAETKPFGFMRFDPGPGWGGHCIPLDPFYLTWKAAEVGVDTKFIELAGEINRRMPHYVIDKLTSALNDDLKPLKNAKVLVVGVAYKPDIGDPRESPAFEIIDLLLSNHCDVAYHDPHVDILPKMRSWPSLPALKSVELSEELLSLTDAVIIVTNHRAVDFSLVRKYAKLIIDTRGVFREDDRKIIRA